MAIENLNFDSSISFLVLGKQSVVGLKNVLEELKLSAHNFISSIVSFSLVLWTALGYPEVAQSYFMGW